MVRFKNRFLLVEIAWEHQNGRLNKPPQLVERELKGEICKAIATNYGDYGLGAVSYALGGTT